MIEEQIFYGNGVGVSNKLWFKKPVRYKIVLREGDLLFVPQKDKTSTILNGGEWMYATQWNIDVIHVSLDCVVFVSQYRKEVEFFTKACLNTLKKYSKKDDINPSTFIDALREFYKAKNRYFAFSKEDIGYNLGKAAEKMISFRNYTR